MKVARAGLENRDDGSGQATGDANSASAAQPQPLVETNTVTTSEDGPFGPGSAAAGPDGLGPAGWDIKGNADSMLFHTPASPWYGRTVPEVWFRDEESARAAGFAHWDRKQR